MARSAGEGSLLSEAQALPAAVMTPAAESIRTSTPLWIPGSSRWSR